MNEEETVDDSEAKQEETANKTLEEASENDTTNNEQAD